MYDFDDLLVVSQFTRLFAEYQDKERRFQFSFDFAGKIGNRICILVKYTMFDQPEVAGEFGLEIFSGSAMISDFSFLLSSDIKQKFEIEI